ncbi:uncharacterized protein EV420DRAFT_1647258 [Desarmillaria tabescens]|uniref:Uncharacterized protein n=1 Tax=Armillaria tabescens TaxID=1929756 RepID=A0AA39JUG8_ARMTA|nr:uncharacterized protein EV420DRAFT_1647258 [Desarmillaria tabescens]KAK0448979.1 hypothetical protein EV420DRAFT_1647258 [Desarmillaria tabescens]
MNANMNSYHIEEDEMLISERIYTLVARVGVAGAIEMVQGMAGNAVTSADGLDLRIIEKVLVSMLTQSIWSIRSDSVPSTYLTGSRLRRLESWVFIARCHPTDPAAFDAWIVSIFLRESVDTTYQHPGWRYARKRVPRRIPPGDPAAFDAWIVSFIKRNKVDKTRHRDAVRDEQQNNIFIDTLSSGSSGLATAMTGPAYPQPTLPWWIVPPGLPRPFHIPTPLIATMVPGWLNNGEPSVMFMSRAHMS